ncbi:helix-turn-helix domain-containing protein [Microbacterium sp. KNMS]
MPTEPWCDEHQVSDHTGIPVSTLRSWRRKGAERVLPFHKIGSLVRYRLSEVDQAIEARRVDVAA